MLRRPGILAAISLVVLSIVPFGWTQEVSAPSPKDHEANISSNGYKLEYVLSELQDGKRVNARSYTLLVTEGDKANLRLGSRVPIVTATPGTNLPPQFQYLDIGVNIDCVVDRAVGGASDSNVRLFTAVDITRLAPEKPGENHAPAPIVRQTKFQVHNIVPLGRQTALTSADEVDGTGRYQVDVTITKMR